MKGPAIPKASDPRLRFQATGALFGLGGDDRLEGSPGNDLLDGGPGNDQLYGRRGSDLLRGQEGNDTLEGAGGQDVLAGGQGNDHFNGGKGPDRIDAVDCGPGLDKITRDRFDAVRNCETNNRRPRASTPAALEPIRDPGSE